MKGRWGHRTDDIYDKLVKNTTNSNEQRLDIGDHFKTKKQRDCVLGKREIITVSLQLTIVLNHRQRQKEIEREIQKGEKRHI